jgi:aminoglycoside phosphotransferase (APT) family kinase protein
MELLAQGRDCDIFDLGDGTILRRSRRAYDQSLEARLLTHAAAHGLPVPKVLELRDDGKDLVMEKVEGPNMAQAVEQKPWKARSLGQTLAELHAGVHQLPVLDGLQRLPEGDAFLHFDLHPQNVIMSPAGPVVIDWTNACIGRPGDDVARAWLLMACAEVQVSPFIRPILNVVRRKLVDGFVDAAGRDEARVCLPLALEVTLLDPHISETEQARGRALVAAEAA